MELILPDVGRKVRLLVIVNTINLALKGLQSSTAIYIYPGTYTIEPGSETDLRGLFHVGIVGLGNQDNMITLCHPLTRVSFTMSDDITIESLIVYLGQKVLQMMIATWCFLIAIM